MATLEHTPFRYLRCLSLALLLQAQAYFHAVVAGGEVAQGLDAGAAADATHDLRQLQEFAAIEEQADAVARLSHLGRHLAQAEQRAERELLVLLVEDVGARYLLSTEQGGEVAVAVEGERAATFLNTDFRQVRVDLLLHFVGRYSTAGLLQEVVALEHAVGTRIGPRAREVGGCQAAAAEEGAEHVAQKAIAREGRTNARKDVGARAGGGHRG